MWFLPFYPPTSILMRITVNFVYDKFSKNSNLMSPQRSNFDWAIPSHRRAFAHYPAELAKRRNMSRVRVVAGTVSIAHSIRYVINMSSANSQCLLHKHPHYVQLRYGSKILVVSIIVSFTYSV